MRPPDRSTLIGLLGGGTLGLAVAAPASFMDHSDPLAGHLGVCFQLAGNLDIERVVIRHPSGDPAWDAVIMGEMPGSKAPMPQDTSGWLGAWFTKTGSSADLNPTLKRAKLKCGALQRKQ